MPIFGLGRSKRSMGLDIGSGFVKLAVVDHDRDEPQLQHVAYRPLASSAIVDGEVVDPGLVGDTIRSLFEEESLEPEHLVISVGGRDVIIKLIKMDRMDAESARETIQWEAGQYVPFDMENVSLDFQITDPEGEGIQMNVLLVAAKRELVENKLALVQEAGLQPDVVDVDAFALHNALELNYPEAMTGLTGLLNIGHDTTTVNILDGGVPVLTRDLAFGTRRLVQDLQREQGLTTEEAEGLLWGEEGENGSGPMLRAFLVERMQEIARGVERAANFLESHDTQEGLGSLYLCGGGVAIPGLADALAERMGVETHVASPLRRLQVLPGAERAVEMGSMTPMLMLAVGLGLRSPA